MNEQSDQQRRDPDQRDPLEDFDSRELSFCDQTRRVFVSGEGRAVIVMAEIPGLYPGLRHFRGIRTR